MMERSVRFIGAILGFVGFLAMPAAGEQPTIAPFPGFIDAQVEALPIPLADRTVVVGLGAGHVDITLTGIELRSDRFVSQKAGILLHYTVDGPEVPNGFKNGKITKTRMKFSFDAVMNTRDGVPLEIPLPQKLKFRIQAGEKTDVTLLEREETEKYLSQLVNDTMTNEYVAAHFKDVEILNVPDAGKGILKPLIDNARIDLLAQNKAKILEQLKGPIMNEWLASLTKNFSLPLYGSSPLDLQLETSQGAAPMWRLSTARPGKFEMLPLAQAQFQGSRRGSVSVSSKAMSFFLTDYLKSLDKSPEKGAVYWLPSENEQQSAELAGFFQMFENRINSKQLYRIGLSLQGETSPQLRPWQLRTPKGTLSFLNLDATFFLIPSDGPNAEPERVDLQLRFSADASQGLQLVNVDSGAYTKARTKVGSVIPSFLNVPQALTQLKVAAAKTLLNAKLAEKTQNQEKGLVQIIGYQCELVHSEDNRFGDSSYAEAMKVSFEIHP